MSSIGTDLRNYFRIFLFGLVVEYILIRYNIVSEDIMKVVAPSWSSTFLYVSLGRLLSWLLNEQEVEK